MSRKYDPKKRVNIPPLVGVSAAADILKVAKSNVHRIERMPDPIMIEGVKRSTPAYIRSEVEKLAEELEAERQTAKA